VKEAEPDVPGPEVTEEAVDGIERSALKDHAAKTARNVTRASASPIKSNRRFRFLRLDPTFRRLSLIAGGMKRYGIE
jgi:hypothetical protein